MHNAIVPVCENYSAFILQDWNKQKPKDNYVIIRRKSLLIEGSTSIVYCCSCDASRECVVDSIVLSLKSSNLADLDEKYPLCIHILAAMPIITLFESNSSESFVSDSGQVSALDHDYGAAIAGITEIYTIATDDAVVCLNKDNSYYIIRVDYTVKPAQLKCNYGCKYLKHKCQHVHIVENHLSDNMLEKLSHALDKTATQRKRYVPCSASANKIPFQLSPKSVVQQGFEGIPSSEGVCSCGNMWSKQPQFYDAVKAYYMQEVVNIKGCHCGFDLAQYPQFGPINTQVAEQRNATLKRLKPMLSYMNTDNYLVHCRLFMWFRSMLTIAGRTNHVDLPNINLFKALSSMYSKHA